MATLALLASVSCGKKQEPPLPGVDSANALPSRGGGCYVPPYTPALGGLSSLALVDPEWAPVVNGATVASKPVLVHGTAADSHVSLLDFPATHVRFDQNTAIRVDDADAGLIATGNASEEGEQVLELEWELGSYPAWAWAGEGDRIVALGRWIFDCGHADPTPNGTCPAGNPCSFDTDCGGAACAGAGGTCRGSSLRCWQDSDCAGARCDGVTFRYRSELHPPQATAVVRQGRGAVLGGAAVPVTRADVFVSGDGGAAGDACVLTHRAALDMLSVNCFPLSRPVSLEPADAPPLATDFAFDVPLPEGGGGNPTWEVQERPTPSFSGAPVRASVEVVPVLTAPPHLAVTVRMSERVGGALPTGYAATILAGWERPPAVPLAHVRVTVRGVAIRDPLKPALADPALASPPGWSMQVALNGEWQEVPGLDAVAAPVTVAESLVFEQLVPTTGSLRVVAHAASFGCVNRLFGQSLGADLAAFGFDTQRTAACFADGERDGGDVELALQGPDFGASAPGGLLTVSSQGGAACPQGGACDGAYALQLAVEQLP